MRRVERAPQMFSFVLFKPKGRGSDWDRTAVPMFGVTKSEYSELTNYFKTKFNRLVFDQLATKG